MNFLKSVSGFMEVALTSAEPEKFLAEITEAGIPLDYITQTDPLSYSFTLRRQDHSYLTALADRRGASLKILKRHGAYYAGKSLFKRPVLLFGILILLFFTCFIPTRILTVRVEGNSSIPARRILEAAESCGISFGASRRDVRSEKVKNALLSALPQLQWTGVNTAGCVATISVRERAEPQSRQEGKTVSSIVAVRDGSILSGTVTRGNALFEVGQAVTEGQILVSGYTDCGLSIRAEQADAEIMAETRRTLSVIAPAQTLLRTEKEETKRNYSLLIGKKRINLWKDSRNPTPLCGRMYEEYYATLPGGFVLPLALCVDAYASFESAETELSENVAASALKEFAREYLARQMVAGSILKEQQRIFAEDGIYRLDGSYVCAEMIGRVQQEQIGEHHGENS